jgi:phenylalanyl-tRNA synthetase beta chain
VRLANPIANDRSVMRQSLLSSVMETVERNARNRERLAMFEIGQVFLGSERNVLPDEPLRLAIALTGPREALGWQDADTAPMDFYDLKGIVDAFLRELHAGEIRYEPYEHPAFHPGKSARIWLDDQPVGMIGELHPSIHQRFEIPDTPLLGAEVDLETVLAGIPDRFPIQPVPAFPPVLEDLAVIVDEGLPAAQVEELIRQEGGRTVTGVRLFDLYRGEQIGRGKKSLAYSLTYQNPERTLTDKEVAAVRQRIIRRLDEQLGARLRS